MVRSMTVTADVETGQLADLVKRLEAGDEVVITLDNKPVARLVPAGELPNLSRAPMPIRSLQGHRVLTPVISQQELADELFTRA